MTTVDVDALLNALGLSAIAPPEPVTGGWSAATLWRIELPDGPHLLRIYDERDAPVVQREALVMNHLLEGEVPVARVVGTGAHSGHAFLLLTWIEGRTLDEYLLSDGNPWRLGMEFGSLQGRLHRITAPEGLPHAYSWPALAAYPDRLLAALEQVSQLTDRLLHLDYHPRNLLVRDGEISGLIDWTNARRGDPRFDVARTVILGRFLLGVSEVLIPSLRPIPRSFFSGWRSGYRDEMGAVREARLFLAWAAYGMIYDLAQKESEQQTFAESESWGRLLLRLQRQAERWLAQSGV